VETTPILSVFPICMQVGPKIFYPGIKSASIKLALDSMLKWWDSSPLTKDGSLSQADLRSVPMKEFQESWAFIYFPVQSIGHAFMGAMERPEVRAEEQMQAEVRDEM